MKKLLRVYKNGTEAADFWDTAVNFGIKEKEIVDNG